MIFRWRVLADSRWGNASRIMGSRFPSGMTVWVGNTRAWAGCCRPPHLACTIASIIRKISPFVIRRQRYATRRCKWHGCC